MKVDFPGQEAKNKKKVFLNFKKHFFEQKCCKGFNALSSLVCEV